MNFLWVILTTCLTVVFADVICPDQRSRCPDRMTCCKLPTDQWGCCPLEGAVCCTDKLHCCPHDTTCNMATLSCDNTTLDNTNTSISWARTLSSTKFEPVQDDILCPDGKKSCQNGNTCCRVGGEPPEWGCCQFPHAVCCPDRLHCCPHGSSCNGSACTSKSTQKISLAQSLRKGLSEVSMRCPNGKLCSDDSTCCDWGCCPFRNAVCCEDGIHCCPSDSQCDPGTGHCRKSTGEKVRKWLKKYQTVAKDPVTCPDPTYQCQEDETCCILESGAYGCCPLPNAVCCEDKEHCCPTGMTCDVQGQTCNQGSRSTSWYAKSRSIQVNDILCPDHTHACPGGTTCCPISDTEYGCCPLPNAVCCEDHQHCCPTGTKCDLSEEMCISSNGVSTPWFLKFKPRQV